MVKCNNGCTLWVFFFLQDYLLGLVERYPELFEGGSIEGGDPTSVYSANFSRKWKGYQSVAILAQENILNFPNVLQRPLEECLLFLTYMTDKNTMERAIHRSMMKKYK